MENNNINIEVNPSLLKNIPKNGSAHKPKPCDVIVLHKITDPLISIIIPAYQEEKIIANTLNLYSSELKQKYNFELIVSDGGSTDKTIEIAEKYADIVVRHNDSHRQTIAEGRNRGAKVAQGKYLLFINADTIPNKVDYFLNTIYNIALGSNGYSKYPALTCTVEAFPNETKLKEILFYGVHNLYVRLLNKINIGMGRGECHIIKSDIFNLIGGYNPALAAGEDFDLYRRIAKIDKIGFIKEIKVFESPRRFQQLGYAKVLFYWILNAVSVMIRNKSVSNQWEAIR